MKQFHGRNSNTLWTIFTQQHFTGLSVKSKQNEEYLSWLQTLLFLVKLTFVYIKHFLLHNLIYQTYQASGTCSEHFPDNIFKY